MTIVSVDAGSLYKIKKKIPSSRRSRSQEQRAEQGELGRHIMDRIKGINKEMNIIFVIKLKKAGVTDKHYREDTHEKDWSSYIADRILRKV